MFFKPQVLGRILREHLTPQSHYDSKCRGCISVRFTTRLQKHRRPPPVASSSSWRLLLTKGFWLGGGTGNDNGVVFICFSREPAASLCGRRVVLPWMNVVIDISAFSADLPGEIAPG